MRPGKGPLDIYFSDSATPALDLVRRAARLQLVQVRGSRRPRWPYNLSRTLSALSAAGGGLTLIGIH